ncbi:MAG: coproporphyrinogen-III oxidase family protein [Pirellulales bacterium]|nr:coproporphyrinogen-III oxidase family protein [Pirellulales bacterium]
MSREATETEVGSYFISNYPPFSQWQVESIPVLEAAMQAPPADVPLGLYLHIPFCRKRCKFCYYKVITGKQSGQIEEYLSALSKEIELLSQLPVTGDRPFRFVYFGGGTPSFLSSKQLVRLVDRLRQHVRWDEAEEVTFECEPGTLSQSKIQTLKKLGITRLSLGVENFNDRVLQENGRAHLSTEIYKSWEWIEQADFDNINIDLIAGMVGETEATWRDSVQRSIKLAPDSVTIYQMELPFNTVYSQDILEHRIEMPVADWATKRQWVDHAFDALANAGYSISTAYTMVRDERKVNFSYRDNVWQGSDLLATGIASFGHVSGVHYQNKPEWQDYIDDLSSGNLPLNRALRPTQNQALIREMILQLKTGQLDIAYFQNKYQTDIFAQWQSVWTSYVQDGFVETDAEKIRLTRQGLLRVDSLLPAFFEKKHQGVRYT